MEPPWVSQGDVFESVPIVRVIESETGAPKVESARGPAMLVTHDCDLDKRSRAGGVAVSMLQFLPVLDLAVLPKARQGDIRASVGKINPPAIFYVGDLGKWEGYVHLGHLYSLPTPIFSPEIKDFSEHPLSVGDDHEHMVLRRVRDRLASLTPTQRALLHQKMITFWTRTKPVQADAQPPLPGIGG